MKNKNRWLFTKLYEDGRKDIVRVPTDKFNKDTAKKYCEDVFKVESNCNVIYAFYLRKFLFSKRFYIMDIDKNFCFNRYGLNF